jgi:hypothetical protein
MTRRLIAGCLCAPVLLAGLMAGCDSPSGNTTAPEGHTGKNPAATGHDGGSPAAGPNSPAAKKAPIKG